MSARRAASTPPIEEVAAVAQRLAVLLSAGVSPASAWQYLAEAAEGAAAGLRPAARAGSAVGSGAANRERSGVAVRSGSATAGVVRAAEEAAQRGESVADALAREARPLGDPIAGAWLGLAAAWDTATRSGAPLAACLREFADSFREIGQLQRDVRVALAGPVATARMVLALPIVGLLFGTVLGFNTLATLFLTLPGLGCLLGGAVLLAAAGRWNRRLVARAQARDPTPGLGLDLMAIAMSGGGSVDRARLLVAETLDRFGSTGAVAGDLMGRGGRGTGPAHTGEPVADPVDRVLALATRAGVPAAELLRSEAEQLRRDARSAGQQRAATLSVTLMLPLGFCVLPAFMLVGVAPLLLSVLSSTLTTF